MMGGGVEEQRQEAEEERDERSRLRKEIEDAGTARRSNCSSPSVIRKPKRPLAERVWIFIKDACAGVITNKEQLFEDLQLPHRYRPEDLQILCEATGFSVDEMKRVYRGFKTECPTGWITEEVFHGIYSRFFPNGAANVSSYSHYVFSTLDRDDNGVITFAEFVVGLSLLLRGSLDDKLKWTFSLYDQNGDGFISRAEMENVVGSVFDLMGRTSDPPLEGEVVSERVDVVFRKMDLNGDGVVSMDEFLQACKADETICRSVDAFTNSAI